MAVGRPAFVSSQFLCHPDAGGISFAHFLGFFLRQNDKGGGVLVCRLCGMTRVAAPSLSTHHAVWQSRVMRSSDW